MVNVYQENKNYYNHCQIISREVIPIYSPKHTLTSRKAYPQTNRIKMLYSSFDLHFFKY